MIRKLLSEAYFVTRLPGGLSYIREGQRLFNQPREEMMRYQQEKYRRLLRYAYEHTKYYRSLFDEIGLFKDGTLVEDRIDDIPVLTKQTLREVQKDLLSDEIQSRKPYSASTSGSTGLPITLWYDRAYMARNRADKMLMGILNGREMGQPELKMWFRDFDLYLKNGKNKDRYFDFFNNRSFCLASVVSEDALKGYIDKINTVKPVQIWSNPAPIYEISKYVLSNGIKIHCPTDIILTSNPLYDEMRKAMHEAFPGTYIANQYGGTEFGCVACSIRDEEPLRIFEHSAILEIEAEDGTIRRDGNGGIIITGLNNYSMPLIRYRMGDFGTILPYGSEKEGSFGTLSEVSGRKLSMLRRRDGSSVTGLHLRDLLTKPFIKTFQLVQHTYDDLEAIVVLDGTPEQHSEGLKEIASRLEALMDCKCRFTFCDSIPSESTGKYFYVRSEIE